MNPAVPVFVPVSFLGIRRHISSYPIKAGSWHYMKSGVAAPIPASPTNSRVQKMRGKTGIWHAGECARFVPVGGRGPGADGAMACGGSREILGFNRKGGGA